MLNTYAKERESLIKKERKLQKKGKLNDYIIDPELKYPPISTAQDLYGWYASQEMDEKFETSCQQDVVRADLGNQDWEIDIKSGKNALYNVLCAYAMYDPEI